ncbi:MAG TPA: DUF4440 domain-containing protein [Candidatus Acidoferrales bacterium]|nr:DUF4440 domain-containing protein [Candidatus Acidoferrales bacterium]
MIRNGLSAKLFLGLTVIAFSAGWPGVRSMADTSAAQQVLEVVRRFQSAGIRGDGIELNRIFDPQITHFHPGSPYRLVGRDRLVREFETAAKSQRDMRFEMIDPQVQMADGNVAVVTYYIVESWAAENNVRNSANEKATEVYVKRNGSWVMIHGHYSSQ